MVTLQELWLPVLLSAVFVFVASSVIHMALPIHKKDYKKLPGEDQVLAAMRAQGVQPGQYMFPCSSSMKEMCSPEMTAKMKQGPVGYVNVIPNGTINMTKALVLWFILSLVVSAFTAYAAGLGLAPGEDGKTILRVTSTIALLGYAVTNVTDGIWKGVRWSIVVKFIFDGLVYALVTGATFAWLWPAAATPSM
jgi:hypothetical protein